MVIWYFCPLLVCCIPRKIWQPWFLQDFSFIKL
jgi:hypothetical protein